MRGFIAFIILLLSFCQPNTALAGDTNIEAPPLHQEQNQELSEQVVDRSDASLKMLYSIIELKKNLETLLPEWKSIEKQILNKTEIVGMSLAEIENEEESIIETSRPFHKKEPWFPCKRNDWVILADGTRGVVISLSHEMVELVQRGGAHTIYQTSDFLAQSPLNLSINFRLKIPFGISYNLQKDSTRSILETLESYIRMQIDKEGYKESLLNLRVEFDQAADSSLDLLVIADFKGDMAPLYRRLSRAIRRWCVDACTLNNWEIPFPQLTLHK